jgi:Mrp family chromosome partitioning ATPase
MTTTDHIHRGRTLPEYLAIIRRRKWVAIIPLLVVPLVAVAYSFQQSPVFEASSEVLLNRQDLGSVLSGRTNADVFTDPDRFAQTQAAIARVPEVTERAVERAKVPGVTSAALLGSSTVAPRGNADLLRFSVKNGDAASAGQLATAYARSYTDYRLELDTAAFASARRDLERRLASLRASGSTRTVLYGDLAQKAQELRTMELLQARAEVVKIAKLGTQVAPTPMRNGVLALAFGLLVGLATLFLWEALDRRVRDEEEIHRTLQTPLLARLPTPRRAGLAMLDDPSDVDAEAVRRLRSSVEFANLDVNAKVIMVTSCVGEEGKTTTISNLAVALARGGHRVALVDLDLRKPMIGHLFGVEFRPGLADVAIERVELSQALIQRRLVSSEPIKLARLPVGATQVAGEEPERKRGVPEGQLFVLPAGFLPASPGELVGTQAVASILATLREQMDFVLVDAPPLLTVSDASTLFKRVDALFLIVRIGIVNRPMLRDLARELDVSSVRKLGFVLTGAEATEGYDSRAYGYGYLSRRDGVEQQAQEPRPASRSPIEVDDVPSYLDQPLSRP